MTIRIAEVGKYYAPVLGGIEHHVGQCARVLAQKFAVKVFCMRRGMGVQQEESIDGIPVYRSASLGSIWRQEIPFGLSRALDAWQPDIVHFHAPNPLVAAQLGDWCDKARLVVTHHADLNRPAPIRHVAWHFYRKILDAADTVIATTRSYVENSIEIAQYRQKVEIVPLGVDETLLQRRSKWDGIRNVGYLGRLERWKGLDLLVELARRRPELRFHIAGAGSYATRFEQRTKAARVREQFTHYGEVTGDRKAQFIRALDALLLPSLNTGESFGIVLVEAQLSGVPVVVSDLPTGVAEIAKNGVYGWTFRTGDAASLDAALRDMQSNPGLVTRIVDQALQNALRNYTESAVADKTLEVWHRIAGRLKDKP